MPFLRFARDKRGYETISLVHAVRRQGRLRHRILYWFRTPPGVKVGRPAFDETIIRAIEEQNPDIEFNWEKILDTLTSAPPPPDDDRGRRGRREKPSRDVRRHAPPAVDAAPERDEEAVELDVDVPPVSESEPEGSTEATGAQRGGPDLERFRARFAELQARITERAGSPERVEALRARAESLNPDTWVTADEVTKGLEEFEGKVRELRLELGLRRRRSRRGGRRRRPAGESGGSPPESGEG